MSRRHFCSGFAFDSITFYSLLAIVNHSSEAIRTKGMTVLGLALWYFLGPRGCILGCLKRFPRLRKKTKLKFLFRCGNFQVPSIFTPTDYSSLISMEKSDVELFHVCHHISRSL